jgi:cytochrome c oxidase subunit 2
MALEVVALAPDAFERWLAGAREIPPPPPPGETQRVRGRAIVERGACAMCHTVLGTTAGGRTAPDLTHFGSRRTIAAGTVANTPAHLADWIRNPQRLKPGNQMPAVHLSEEDLDAVVAYLESLS